MSGNGSNGKPTTHPMLVCGGCKAPREHAAEPPEHESTHENGGQAQHYYRLWWRCTGCQSTRVWGLQEMVIN